ncbi:hypothetical protein [Sorangium sp. So ce1099]|uniref:hypothetical protein n=1 Tax=Sorangium sp. So ce1099 TaxID=3133331 RepID=UPI003F635F58
MQSIQNPGKSIAAIASGLVFGLAIGGMQMRAARAGDSASCARYADSAVQQQLENIRRGCGFSGPRWSTDRNGHYNWCLGVSDTEAFNENAGRAESLRLCR